MEAFEYKIAIKHIIDGLLRKKKGQNSRGVFFFLGAGFSMKLPGEINGIGNAKDIAIELAEKVGIEGEENLLRVAEYIEVIRDKRELINLVKEHIDNHYCIKDSHKMMCEIIKILNEPQELIYTTNYDTFIEDHFIKEYDNQLKSWHYNDSFSLDKTLYKIHGCIKSESHIVLTSEDYYKIKSNESLIKRLFTVFRENTCVFIGFSLEDQYLVDMLFSIRASNEDFGQQKHYIVIPEGGINKFRAKYLKEKFNIEHLTVGRDEFLLEILTELKKKVMMRE
ncbi:MAG: SIR2 family protein [Paenibacillus dendritiformis]|uniref:SIR2 family NAD-dependent protein deacylase n=1 Tax=uncultured Paenibacillus sp. TaxID=227322 RepID=UPI002600F93E|nr:SIR2 family protein [uncultured Paenibacillus sp.]MDU5143665.1 SIR2 family protein [Paenibacillus dendritiformis]